MGGVILRGGVTYDFGGGTRVGLTLDYDYLDYSFSPQIRWGSDRRGASSSVTA